MTDRSLSPPEVALRLNVSEATVRRMVQDGRLRGERHPITGRVAVDPASVAELVERHEL